MEDRQARIDRRESAAEWARVLGIALIVITDLTVGAAHEAARIDDASRPIDRLTVVSDVVAERIERPTESHDHRAFVREDLAEELDDAAYAREFVVGDDVPVLAG